MIDGPSLLYENVKRKDAVNSDIINIIEHHPPEIIIVDIRRSTLIYLEKNYGDLYDVFPSDIITNKIKADYRYFSVLKKKK